MSKLFRYAIPYIPAFLLLAIFVFIQSMTNLHLPDYMADIVNKGIIPQDNTEILHTGLLMLAVALAGGLATVFVSYLASKIATGFARRVREALFAKVESFSMQEFGTFSTASLITRTTNDITQIQMVLVMLLRMVLMAPMLGIGAIFKAYALAPSMSWMIAVSVGAMFCLIIFLFTIALPKFTILQKLVDQLNLVTRENLTGLRVIRAFNNERYEEEKFERANEDLTNLNLFINRALGIMQPVMLLIFNITSIAIIWVGAHQISSGNLAIGDMIAFMQYAMQVIMSFLFLSFVFILIPRASVSGKRINEVLRTPLVITDPQQPQHFIEEEKGKVEFRHVYFAYPESEAPVLKDITFTALPGQTTAFIGSTGSGKSTLINLIPRMYDVTQGEVLVDGVDVRSVSQHELHAHIGFVPQKGNLFSGTIAGNISYGNKDIPEEEIHRAAEIAQASEFITKLPEGYNAPISQNGTNVSGGQKQRLSIARAIAKKPDIYIFDDSFSALDFKTDAALRRALHEATKDATVLIVSQRVSTIMHAEQIVVLDEGSIVGIGRHTDLLQTCPVYKEIASSQLSQQEIQASIEEERSSHE